MPRRAGRVRRRKAAPAAVYPAPAPRLQSYARGLTKLEAESGVNTRRKVPVKVFGERKRAAASRCWRRARCWPWPPARPPTTGAHRPELRVGLGCADRRPALHHSLDQPAGRTRHLGHRGRHGSRVPAEAPAGDARTRRSSPAALTRPSAPATVALVGSISAPPAEVVAFYTKALEAQGFKAVPGRSRRGRAVQGLPPR